MVKHLSRFHTSGFFEMSCMKTVSVIFLNFRQARNNQNAAITNTFQGAMLKVRQILIFL